MQFFVAWGIKTSNTINSTVFITYRIAGMFGGDKVWRMPTAASVVWLIIIIIIITSKR